MQRRTIRYLCAAIIGLYLLSGAVSANPVLPFPYNSKSIVPFFIFLSITWLIEIPILVLLLRYFFKQKDTPLHRIVLVGIICTGLTYPYLWFLVPQIPSFITLSELFVVIVEAFLIRQFLGTDYKVAALCSIIMNGASFIIGLMIGFLYL